MVDYLANLLDTTDFTARWECGNWTPGHGWLHILSDIAIFGAYAAIPAVLIFFVMRRKDIPLLPVFLLFAGFILFCGIGHLIEATLYWKAWYRLSGLVKLATALISWATVVALIQLTPKALALPGLAQLSAELQVEVRQREQAQQLLQHSRDELEGRVLSRTEELNRANTLLHEEFARRQRAVEASARHADELKVQRLAALNLAQDADEAKKRAQRNEEAVATANRELQAEITQRQRTEEELRRMSAELARSNAELEQFAYIASHDLQEPLRKVQSFGDLLAAKAGPVLGAEERDYLKRMQTAAQRMQVLISDLLAFARVTSQAKPFVPVDLTRVAREVLSDLEARVKTTGGRVEIGELPHLESDPLQMRQLLQNLIGNALKFHRPDVPPVINLEARVAQNDAGMFLPHSGSDQVCEIKVCDNGIGFDEKYLDRIFLPFQRLHGRGEYEGTGMGLAICRKIVERHGGTITASSAPGQGTTFIVLLPLRQPKAAESPEPRV